MGFYKDQANLLSAYYIVQEELSQKTGHRVVLVGTARYARSCPKCRIGIPKGTPIVNFGKVNDRWDWICVSCAPADPYELLHVKALLTQQRVEGPRETADSTPPPPLHYAQSVGSPGEFRDSLFQSFAPAPDSTGGHDWDFGGPAMMRCPICAHEYVHPLATEVSDWSGRGHCLRIGFRCERDHYFYLPYGFHKGNTWCFWYEGTASKAAPEPAQFDAWLERLMQDDKH